MTLSDALESQYAQRKRARPFLESALPIPSTDMGRASSARRITPSTETVFTEQSQAAQLGPSRFKNIQGDFTVVGVRVEWNHLHTVRRHTSYGWEQVQTWGLLIKRAIDGSN